MSGSGHKGALPGPAGHQIDALQLPIRLENRLGQLVQQVREAIRVGRLKPRDQLPTVREVVTQLAINPQYVATPLSSRNSIIVLKDTESIPGLGLGMRVASIGVETVGEYNRCICSPRIRI
jgi:hypothetical protein